MVVHAFRARMRQDDRRRRQRQHVAHAIVRSVRSIKDQSQPVGFAHQLLAGRAEPAECRRHIGGTVRKLIVPEMHRRHHPQSARIECLEKRRVLPERIGIFHALEHDLLAAGKDPLGVGGREGKLHVVCVLRRKFADRYLPEDRCRARRIQRRIIERTLRREDHPEAAVQPTLDHARQVHMRAVRFEAAALGEGVLGRVEVGGRVEVAVEHHQVLVQSLGGREGRRLGRRGLAGRGRRRRGAPGQQNRGKREKDTFHAKPHRVRKTAFAAAIMASQPLSSTIHPQAAPNTRSKIVSACLK